LFLIILIILIFIGKTRTKTRLLETYLYYTSSSIRWSIYNNSAGGFMEKNAGTIDRFVRIVIGIVLLYAVLTNMVQGIFMYVAGILGLMMLATAALAYCPLYPVMKINTACKPDK
jgi:hypothetical protein